MTNHLVRLKTSLHLFPNARRPWNKTRKEYVHFLCVSALPPQWKLVWQQIKLACLELLRRPWMSVNIVAILGKNIFRMNITWEERNQEGYRNHNLDALINTYIVFIYNCFLFHIDQLKLWKLYFIVDIDGWCVVISGVPSVPNVSRLVSIWYGKEINMMNNRTRVPVRKTGSWNLKQS